MPTIFSPDQLNALVATLPTLPAGHKNAIVATVDQNGAKVIAGFSAGPDNKLKFSGAFEHDWSGENKVGAQLLYSW